MVKVVQGMKLLSGKETKVMMATKVSKFTEATKVFFLLACLLTLVTGEGVLDQLQKRAQYSEVRA